MRQPRSQVRPAGHGTRDAGKPRRSAVAQFQDGRHGIELTAKGPETLRIVADGHPHPGTIRLLGKLNPSDVEAYRKQVVAAVDVPSLLLGGKASVLVDPRAASGGEPPTGERLGQAKPSGRRESPAGEREDALGLLSAMILEDSPAEFTGGIVPPGTSLAGTMSFLGSMMPGGGTVVPRSGIRPDLVDRFVTLRECAHCHRTAFGIPARPDAPSAPDRVGESFADAVAIAALVLESGDAKELEEIEQIVLAREVASLSGTKARNSGAAARRAFRLAVERMEKHGKPETVTMRGIMRQARRLASECTLKSGHDLDAMRKAVLARAGALGELPAKVLARRIRDAADDLEAARREGKADATAKLKEPGKACAELRAAADAIERGMWTTADLSERGRGKEYGEALRKDLLETLKDHRRRGMPNALLRFLILNEHRLGSDTAISRMRTRSAAAAAGKARQLPRPDRQPLGTRFVALRSESIGPVTNPWRRTLPMNIEALGRLSRQAANIAAEAGTHPGRAEMLQDRFDDVMIERTNVIESIILSDATLGALMKLKGDDQAARTLAEVLKEQVEWDVTGEFTYLADLSQDDRKGLTDQLGAVANALGEATPQGRAPIKRMPAGVTVNERGFAVNRSEEGRIHCEDDWAIKGPNGERFAYIKDQRAMVVRLVLKDGAKATTRLMTRDEATAFVDAYGGEMRDPTDEDFKAIRGESADGDAPLRLWQG